MLQFEGICTMYEKKISDEQKKPNTSLIDLLFN